MPNHLHLLLSPPGNGRSVSEFIGAFKSRTTRIAWEYGFRGKIWQARFFDHIVRDKGNIGMVIEYILNNPVKGGLSAKWGDYRYCECVDPW
jgi:putative transposase